MIRSTPLSRVWSRGIRRGVTSAVREEGWGVSVGSLFGVLFLAQVLVLLVIGVHAGLTLLREETDIRLEVLDGSTDVQLQDFIQALAAQPYVQNVVHITKQQAYEDQRKRDPQLIGFLQKFGIDNPFADTVGVRLRTLDDYPRLVTFLRQPLYAHTIDPKFLSQKTDQEAQIYKLLDIVTSARAFLLFVIGLLVVVLVFIIVELVRRRALQRREELFVEQLVGATPLAILIPFCVEIFALLLLALLLSVVVAAGCIVLLPIVMPSLAPSGIFALWGATVAETIFRLLPVLLCTEFLALPIASSLGTFLALWPKLKGNGLMVEG